MSSIGISVIASASASKEDADIQNNVSCFMSWNLELDSYV
jgi:hypothetical protein